MVGINCSIQDPAVSHHMADQRESARTAVKSRVHIYSICMVTHTHMVSISIHQAYRDRCQPESA